MFMKLPDTRLRQGKKSSSLILGSKYVGAAPHNECLRSDAVLIVVFLRYSYRKHGSFPPVYRIFSAASEPSWCGESAQERGPTSLKGLPTRVYKGHGQQREVPRPSPVQRNPPQRSSPGKHDIFVVTAQLDSMTWVFS